MLKRKREGDIAVLSREEIEILKRGLADPSIITDYFFRLPGKEHGWRFDYNFDPEGAWQKKVCQAQQTDIVVLGGFGTGKTVGVGMSACVWGVTTHPDFKFLNAAPTAKQARFMYDDILREARGTRFEDLIFSAPESPYPKIELRFWVDDTLVISLLEFMSVDKNASAIYGWEGDWINLDEAFLNDNLEEILTIVGSRLRGSVQGRSRLGRLSMITNSHDNFFGWYLADLAQSDPEHYLTLTISSRHNHNINPEQLRKMLARIPEDERERFIEGTRPEGKGEYFSKQKVYGCESEAYGTLIKLATERGEPGYAYSAVQGPGAIYFTTPCIPGHVYVLVGDPGTDNAPKRNAPALMVFDATEMPNVAAKMVAMWWGFGHGSITPFVGVLLRFMLLYRPIVTAVDNTGPQKNTAELLNYYLKSERLDDGEIVQWLGDEVQLAGGIRLPRDIGVTGLDFSGGRKPAFLVAGRILIEAGKFVWPKFFVGLRSQLTNYDPLKDKAGEPKIPQDLVATLCMAAQVIRVWFAVEMGDRLGEMGEDAAVAVDVADDRAFRRGSSAARSSSYEPSRR